MRPAEGCAGGPARTWRRFEGGPATQDVAEDCGGFLLKPMQPVRARVLEGTGEAVGAPHFVADHAAPLCDELGARASWGSAAGEAVVCRDGCAAVRAGGRRPWGRLWPSWAGRLRDT